MADVDLESLGSLEYLDLSRNLIQEIQPGTFLGMSNLKGLDFSVNVVRKVCNLVFVIWTFFEPCSPRLKTMPLRDFEPLSTSTSATTRFSPYLQLPSADCQTLRD